ncbi:hypothetical protein GNI_214160 [Gregarina niphandrodes]|uniref:Uncharacterized protein n=1 Tax=Gregarina niphandrodes TaxID=110365 RepID=A0A023AVX9_GRENI|nr:hypothetical protein GNI_214160 [Gregarina niphandrodes]EZG42871.1 hypothetical protein GNI_214160 [Gregarina niphandrodes]|eukprot:XP_011133850.1 hypothetical protein GNI_214160 [Gregarina niphandrodes]
MSGISPTKSTQDNVGSQVANQYWGELDIRLRDKEIHTVTGVVLPEVHQLILGLPHLIGHNARLHTDEYQEFEIDTQATARVGAHLPSTGPIICCCRSCIRFRSRSP